MPDPDTHPAVRAGAEALGSVIDEYDIRRADDNPEEWCAECLPRDAAAINAARLVAPAVLRWAIERLRAESKIADDPTWNSILGAVDALKDELTTIERNRS